MQASWLADFVADLRHGARQLLRHPLVALVCTLTLALGIGANAAMFSALDAVLLRPLPFPHPDRLVLVSEYKPGNVAKTGSPFARYQARAAENTVFEQTAAYWHVSGGDGVVFGSSGSAERLQFSIVSNSFFAMLGVQPQMGRGFTEAEGRPGNAKVFLASDALWHRLMGGNPRAVGQSFNLDGEPYTLIGVLPPAFEFPRQCDLWLPFGSLVPSYAQERLSHQFWMLGRLRRGATLAQAQAELGTLQQRMARDYPATDGEWRVRLTPLLDEYVGDVRRMLWVLFAAVGFILLIACSNVTNLLLARAVAREKEFAVRAALGASRGRLLRQTLAETLLLAAAGTALALAFAAAGMRVIVALSAGSIPRLEDSGGSTAVFAFAIALVLATTLLVGAAPGLQASGIAFTEALQAGQRGGTSSRHSSRLRSLLVISEVALTVLLLSGAGLMLRSFRQLRAVDPGFRTDQLTSVRVALPEAQYPKTEQRAAFLRELLQRLQAAPGIAMAAVVDRLPLTGENNWGGVNIVGRPLLDSGHAPSAESREISADYFRTMEIPLLRGREFTEAEVTKARPVTIINRAMAEQFWPGGDPLGQRIASPYHPERTPREIVGVVGDVKDFGLDAQSPPVMYSPYSYWTSMHVVVRSGLGEQAVVNLVRREVAAMDRGVALYDIHRLNELVHDSVARQRFELWLLAAFAGVALALAAVGIYGVLAFSVSRRTHEIGVRLALGGSPRGVLGLVVRQGMRLVAIGLAAGIVAAVLLTRTLQSLLFRVGASDPLTLACVAGLLAVVGAVACWVPARRAMQVDPMVTLRSE
ncbi:MAG TPA: ABC transporter permease [Terriglobales bacterium]|nr:ABC transporter permease [Terriglobales bacterium]